MDKTPAELQNIQTYLPKETWPLVQIAFDFAFHKHDGIFRSNGEPFFAHVTDTAKMITSWTQDANMVISALLHDTLDHENTKHPAEQKEIHALFGENVLQIVDIVHSRGNETHRNLFWEAEISKADIPKQSNHLQAFLIKLASGLNLARDLKSPHMELPKGIIRGKELLARYAPLSAQFGMWDYKRELEDACLLAIAPDEHKHVLEWQYEILRQNNEKLEQLSQQITANCAQQGISCAVKIHPRHAYSIYQALSSQRVNRISDIKSSLHIDQMVRIEICLDTTLECYATLGAVHQAGNPAHDFLRDFIARPKPNGYSALHTAIQFDKKLSTRIKVNIRTQAMYQIGNQGILYKPELQLWNLEANHALNANNGERVCLDTLRNALLHPAKYSQKNEITTLTPQGKQVVLPGGAMPLDFAYVISTELGDKFSYATINHELVSIDYELHDGDLVEIYANPTSSPQIKWLEYAQTNRAQQKIRHWLTTAPREVGKTRLFQALEQHNVHTLSQNAHEQLETFARKRLISLDSLFEEIGLGKLDLNFLIDEIFSQNDLIRTPKIVFSDGQPLPPKMRSKQAGCCRPNYPDEIIGCIRGTTIITHHKYCINAERSNRKIAIMWENEQLPTRMIKIKLRTEDRQGLINEVGAVVADQFYNIKEFHAKSHGYYADIYFELELPSQFIPYALTNALRAIPGIQDISSPQGIITDTPIHYAIGQNIGGLANPYSPGRPIFDRNMFFGRQQELASIQQFLLPVEHPTSVMLCAQRRAGKTSLAWRVKEQKLIRRAYFPIYMDISASQRDNDQALLSKINKHLLREIPDLDAPILERNMSLEQVFWGFEQTLDSLHKLKKKNLLLILDEFEAALNAHQAGNLSDEFFIRLRSWSQWAPVTFLIVGSKRLAREIAQKFPELANVFQVQNIGAFREIDARRLILEPSRYRIEYDEDAIQMILEQTGMYPYYIHLMCVRLYNQVLGDSKTHITKAMVEKTFHEMCNPLSRSHYAHLWNSTNWYHEIILAALAASSEGHLTRSQMCDTCQVQDTELGQALRELQELGTIDVDTEIHQSPRYRIRLPLFSGWVLNNFSIPHLHSRRPKA